MHYRELEPRPAVSLRKRTRPVDAAPQHRPAAAAVLALQRRHGNRYKHTTAAVQRMSWYERNELQVHWHPATENYPDDSWTVRWANEGSGNNQPATEWMKDMVRKTGKGLDVALASQGGGGTEYRAQFPSLSGD
jgi:hypothetical protein